MSNLIGKNHPGIWSGVLAGLSILSCYGTLALVAILVLLQ